MIYAIGDIHGHLDKLKQAHEAIEADRARVSGAARRAPVVHIGDLVDRGPDSKGVIDYLMDGIAAGKDWLVVRGNHDQMFVNFVRSGVGTVEGRKTPHWLSDIMGGSETMKSYGVKRRFTERQGSFQRRARLAVPETHLSFIEKLPLWYKADGMIFVHAGIRPGFPLEAQDENDLLWIRDEFLWHHGPHEAVVVHGHTPVDEPTHYRNRVNLDSGAGWGNPLVPVVFENGECFTLTGGIRAPILSL